MAAPPEIPRELLEVAAWLSRVPWIWRALRDELAEQQARKVHFRLRLDLVGSYGSVKDAHVKLKAIDDLKRRLASTRWPERETVGDWSQGVPLQKAQRASHVAVARALEGKRAPLGTPTAARPLLQTHRTRARVQMEANRSRR